ncbi:polymorphic toxin-type HINT domain-containing protein [Capnocytophaga canimorsus]|uniref:polymorphic toxin-type HINT domain-containing protein n=1 Tax=Capnocytophaga canimorsus TaxID=28188 RepID=UPI001BB3EB53|nr:polymorphic toxin-type HINT domain-containing protein [Capnocytophaga canimorsus]
MTTTDRIKTQNHQWQRIKAHNFLYQTKKVYNFKVENWHTYFVGLWAVLVHNACEIGYDR